MKILYVVTGLGLGGAERVVVDLADQFFLKGHDVKIAYLTGKVLVKPNAEQIEIIALGVNGSADLFKASQRYRRLIKTYQPDIVHAHMIHANIFSRLNRIGCVVPRLICTAHSSNEGGKARMLAYSFTNFLSDFNSNVSQEATKSLINHAGFSEKNLITVYNGVDLNKFKKLTVTKANKPSNEIKILAIGNFNPPKDYPNLLYAIALLKNITKQKFKLEIVGDGNLRQMIESLITELKLEDVVTLLGKRADIADLLNQADIFVLASQREGLPTVVLEAMACQCYVVATDCGGTKEIMANTGTLLPSQNSEALAQALNDAFHLTPQEISENNIKARQRVEELFSLEKSVENWLKIYKNE